MEAGRGTSPTQLVRKRAATVAIAMLAAALVSQVHLAGAQARTEVGSRAQGPRVTGLTAVQHHGFTRLAWNPEPGATQYQVARMPVDAAGVPTGPPEIVGVWQSNRTVTPTAPTFADSGFVPGGRYQWRVGVLAPTPGLPSDPVTATTLLQFGTGPGASLRTEWETNGNVAYTSDVNEYAYTAALDAASDRVRVVELGRTVQNRAINMFVIGYPTPPATVAEIADSPSYGVSCVVHGNEASGVDACLIMARELAFTQDPQLLGILSNVTVLLVLGLNADGRALNTRGNANGQDLNRDHSLLREPETKAFSAFLRDYTPQVLIDSHHGDSEDLPILGPRHANVAFSIYDEGKNSMIEDWMYDHAAVDGWWMGPYNTGGLGEETILRNTMGLKNGIAMLAEARPTGGITRPGEVNPAANLRRLVYSHRWEFFQGLEYHAARLPQIEAAIAQSIAFNRSNTGRVVFRGSWPWPPFPSVGQEPPDEDAPAPNQILAEPPCGYFLTEAQYTSTPEDKGTVALRLGLHGMTVQHRPSGHIVRMAQPLRGLIPLLLDDQAAEELVAATRLSECPHVTASPRSFTVATQEGTQKTATLAIGNAAVEANEPLEWTITEAASSCSTPGNLPWFSAAQTSGTTASGGGSTNVQLTFSAAGITAPATRTGVLCLASNDAGEALIAVPLTLQVTGPTAVTVRSFSAGRRGGDVVLRWRTASEIGSLGFDVYRTRGGSKVKLNRQRIRGPLGLGRGHTYAWRDRSPVSGGRYWLHEVRLGGKRVVHGPVTPR
ncbi:MAG: M14 family zinc carboxypeptidase [Gaiellaceae bacterium]